MQNIPRLPVDAAGDDVLIQRLYELALQGEADSNEARLLDHVVYARLLHAYGCEAPDQQPRLAA